MHLLVEEADWDLQDLHAATMNAIDGSFMSLDDKADLIVNVVQPAWEG